MQRGCSAISIKRLAYQGRLAELSNTLTKRRVLMVAKVIMTDSIRNKVVGIFGSTTEALKYAKEEDIKVVSFEIYKG